MPSSFIVAGTDTGIGKTVLAAALVRALDGIYWKPVQAGLDGETDTEAVRRLSGLPADRMLPEAYRLSLPASPHIAAARQGVAIAAAALRLPQVDLPLVVEGAGGLMVPLAPGLLQIDLFASWNRPVILCARTALGTINHTLLSVEALRHRGIPLHGLAFIGDPEPDAEQSIVSIGGVRRLGRLPRLPSVCADALHAAFLDGFDTALLADAGGAA